MTNMRVIVVVVCGAVACGRPIPDRFKPMVEACKAHDTESNCTAAMQGKCKTGEDGTRSCDGGCHHHWHKGSSPAWVKKMEEAKKEMGFDKHHSWGHHEVQLGDCGSKQDGDTCTIQKEGRCIPTGKCPIFHGAMACSPNDAHAPKFVTEPCEGKKVGDDCKMWMMSGKCEKPKYMNDMFCKVHWPFEGVTEDDSEEKPAFQTLPALPEWPHEIVVV